MKKTLLTLTLLFLIQYGFSQCAVSANNFGNNQVISMYNVTGDVNITLNSSNSISLDLGNNFATADGPDIRAFLVKSNGMSNEALSSARIADLESIEFGLVGCTSCGISPNGAKSFTVDIPTSENIETYDRIFFYCLQFNQFWDFGSFTPFSASNCNSILSIEDNILNNVTLYPNPAKDKINISGKVPNIENVTIYNTLGELVINQKNDFTKGINTSNLEPGLYVVSINTLNSNISKRILIE
ncbi:T9SS type A sorting domain-containing protein [uncultured Algibacter sp.]|uniref:T9SS type A sorting domain-containing protein n=1 Tax=uncultured Algibacter sp. TaxID=298659 RepID=UPI0032174143